jgi:hypothetical protein
MFSSGKKRITELIDSIQVIGETIALKRTGAEYSEIMSAEMNALYLLAFLLTTDKEKAHECLDESGDLVDRFYDFMEWARVEGRRAVIRHAIKLMRPEPKTVQDWQEFSVAGRQWAMGYPAFQAITNLPAFERFVFIMTKIDRQSDGECARLLGTTSLEVSMARELAERIFAPMDCGLGKGAEPLYNFASGSLFNQRCTSC